MAQPTAVISPDVLKRAADRLGEVSQKLMDAYNLLSGEDITEAVMPWTNAHRSAVEKLVFVSGMLEGAAKVAIDADKDDRRSDIELRREKNRADYLKRLEKKRAAGDAPKPRGRPKKTENQ